MLGLTTGCKGTLRSIYLSYVRLDYQPGDPSPLDAWKLVLQEMCGFQHLNVFICLFTAVDGYFVYCLTEKKKTQYYSIM